MSFSKGSAAGALDYALLVLLAAIWGSSFLVIKIGVETIPAATLTAARILIAAIVLTLVAVVARERIPWNLRTWGLIVLSGLFGNAFPFTLISWGEEHIDSALAAILMAVMPLTTVVLAHLFTDDEKLSLRKLVGVGLGLVGLIILVGPDRIANLGSDVVHQFAVAMAAVCYGANAVVIKRLIGCPRLALAGASMVAASLFMIPLSLIFDGPMTAVPATEGLLAACLLGVVQTAIATLAMFALISRQGASFFSQINFLVPLFGLAWGALLLGEDLPIRAYAALGVILAGVAIARSGMTRQPILEAQKK